jgi:Zn-dependent protease with chaperone function
VTFGLRLAVIALATFATVSAVASLLILRVARRPTADSAAARARTWFVIRLMPFALALFATVQGVVSFALFEPRGEVESFGFTLFGLALVATALWIAGVVRWISAVRTTDRTLRKWLATAEPVTLPGCSLPAYAVSSPFPIVAVVGLIRPVLVIARQVVAACAPDELEAIVAHEERHVARHDNLRRAILLCLPDPLAVLPAGRRLATYWHDAIEDVADEAADDIGPTGKVRLAAALVRVARLAPPDAEGVLLPASALYRGEDISRRVKRLLAPPAARVERREPVWHHLILAAAIVVVGLGALHAIHELVELAASVLP